MKLPVLTITALTSLLTVVISHSQSPHHSPDPFAKSTSVDPFQDPSIGSPRMIRVHAEFIDMPHATYTALMAAPRTSTDDTDLRTKCAKLISSNEARMVESLSINAFPGQNATSESITEFIYPTEYSPSDGLGPMAAEGLPLTFPFPPAGSPPTPPAFDTKNVGSTLEVEAQIDNSSNFIDLRLTPTLVYLADQLVITTWKNDEVTVDTTMPLFYVLKTKTAAVLAPGQPHMISALSPQNEQGYTDHSRKIMLFVRADIITIGK